MSRTQIEIGARTNSPTLGVVTRIWGRLLGQRCVEPDENFFEAGGNQAIAIKLFSEIARLTGRELPPMLIYQSPTPAKLAQVIARPDRPHYSPVVKLRAGTKSPVFLAHGIGGSLFELSNLVEQLDLPNAIYGMQLRGLDGVSSPLSSIEEMARVYLGAIRKVQPQGPYLLIGYSLGGLVMLEIAQRLSKNGHEAKLLALVDSYPHSRFLSARQRIGLIGQRAGRRISSALYLPREDSWGANPDIPRLYIAPESASFAPVLQRVRDNAYTALKRYRPQFYDGTINFFKASVPSRFPHDPAPVWRHLTAGFHIESLPGDHLGLITTHSGSLASALARHVREAVS